VALDLSHWRAFLSAGAVRTARKLGYAIAFYVTECFVCAPCNEGAHPLDFGIDSPLLASIHWQFEEYDDAENVIQFMQCVEEESCLRGCGWAPELRFREHRMTSKC
jgi:hypothetical protein